MPDASEKHLLIVGKISTLVFGAIIIVCALLINRFRTIGLFDLANQLAANLLMPLALPLIYGLFYQAHAGVVGVEHGAGRRRGILYFGGDDQAGISSNAGWAGKSRCRRTNALI